MQAGIGHRVEPVAQLEVEVVEVPEAARQEEILADVAERPLDFSLRLWPVGTAGLGLETEVAGQVEQAAVVDDKAIDILADHSGFHAVVEDLAWRAAQCLEG